VGGDAGNGGGTRGSDRRSLAAALALAGWLLVVAAVVSMVWLDHLARRAGRGDLGPLADVGWIFAAGVLVAATVGAVVVWRARHPVGWLLMALGGTVVGSGLAEAYAVHGLLIDPGGVPGADRALPFAEALFWPAFTCLALIVVLTPSGRAPSERWRWFIPITVGGAGSWVLSTLLSDEPGDPPLDGFANPFAVDALEVPVAVLGIVGIVVTHGSVVAAGVSIVGRARRATGLERQQLRWVRFGASVAGVAVIVALISAVLDQAPVLGVAAATLITILPVTVAIAVSRYRLYDLDRVISRSLVYAVLSLAVAASYAASVAGLALVGGEGRVASGAAAVAAAMFVAPVRSRTQRGVDRVLFGRRADPFAVVSTLNQRLQASASPESALRVLVDAIAVDLRLPAVAVEALDGSTLAASGELSARVDRLPLAHQGEDVGWLVLGLRRGEDAFDPGERALLEDLARHAGATVRAALTSRDLQTARHRLVSTREEERRRLRRDLHDGLGPQLTAVTLKVDAARNLLDSAPRSTDALLVELRADVRAAIEDIRRVVYELRPPGLDELGLVGALRQHARACTNGSAQLRVDVEGNDIDGLPAPVEVAAYRIATEAITNAVRHSRAHRCEVRVEQRGDLVVEVSDDGIGLPSPWRAGVGVTAMRERATELGGNCTIEAPEGCGTTVRARLPVAPVVS
jgi:two-component system NarL family sensor kinase